MRKVFDCSGLNGILGVDESEGADTVAIGWDCRRGEGSGILWCMSIERFESALAAIDAENAQDPRRVDFEGKLWPYESLYAHRMSECLAAFDPAASEPLRLAARAQHIRRWDIPRRSHPMDRKGYHLWRTRLYGYHAQVTGRIMRQAGYDPRAIQIVADLLMKKRIKQDSQMQTLEDVVCLVFLRHYFQDFIVEHEDAKIITILRRTWSKMSDRGRAAALKLDFNERAARLIGQALGGPAPQANPTTGAGDVQ